MAEEAVFAGAALRRLRRREALTQAAMAERLGISPSYLNLIERNQRPLTARVMMQVIDRFDFDPRALRVEEAVGGVAGLARRIQDERFADLGIDREDIAEFLSSSPQLATAFADTVADIALHRRRHPTRWPNPAAKWNAGGTTLPSWTRQPRRWRTKCACRAVIWLWR